MQDKGVHIRKCDLKSPEEELEKALTDIDVVISCVGSAEQQDQIPIANAARRAGVKRFIPCGFITVAPPGGIMWLRDEVFPSPFFFLECCLTSLQKEAVYNHIKQLSLPYTIIDIGWWYQLAYPRLESGKLDYAMTAANNEIIGEGNTPMALTDLRDIGRWVSRIISDDRTLNKMVFAYDTVMTQNQIYSLLEEISGEEVVRNHVCLFSSGISASTNYSRSPKNSFRTESSPPASQVKPILSTPSSLFPAIWLNTNSRGAFEATTLPSTPNTLAT